MRQHCDRYCAHQGGCQSPADTPSGRMCYVAVGETWWRIVAAVEGPVEVTTDILARSDGLLDGEISSRCQTYEQYPHNIYIARGGRTGSEIGRAHAGTEQAEPSI